MFLRFSRSFSFQSNFIRCYAVNPTSKYIPATFDRPRYSLKRFNLQLAQSVFCNSPNIGRTQLVYKVMKHDGVKGDHVTYYILFSAIKEHRLWGVLNSLYKEMKELNIKVDYDIYTTLNEIYEISGLDSVKEILQEIKDNGYVHKEKEKEYASFFFNPITDNIDEEGNQIF